MIHRATKDEHLWIYSMGKRFRVRAVTTTDDEANEFMDKNRDTAVIASQGPFVFIANTYEGLRDDE